jgi:hypothetical protein
MYFLILRVDKTGSDVEKLSILSEDKYYEYMLKSIKYINVVMDILLNEMEKYIKKYK